MKKAKTYYHLGQVVRGKSLLNHGSKEMDVWEITMRREKIVLRRTQI